MSTRIDQLLHGYRHGHEILAGSLKLPAKDAELVARLSDLSGTPLGQMQFEPYITAYPLSSGTHFAIGKTWPDINATRSGCVLTHTLLIPTDFWRTVPEPRIAEHLFSSPLERRNESSYEKPLMWPSKLGQANFSEESASLSAATNFVQLYFSRGRRPIVWLGNPKAYDALWRVLRSLWPALRARFAACTYCLQPRTLDDRPFDLIFAPDEAYPRFLKIDPDNLLANDQPHELLPQDGWCKRWAERVFFTPASNDVLDPDLFNDLDDDPTAIRRLYLIDTAMRSDVDMPQKIVGAMDLVESIARQPDFALRLKNEVAKRAVTVAAASSNTADGLESLLLIEVRLRRPTFSRVAEKVGPQIATAVAGHTTRDPEQAIKMTPKLTAADGESWFANGLVEGFRQLALHSDSRVAALRSLPSVKAQLFPAEPAIAIAYMKALFRQRNDPSIRRAITEDLTTLKDQLPLFRNSLLCNLTDNDTELIGDLLKGLKEEEVIGALDAVFPLLNNTSIAKVIEQSIAKEFPSATRSWVNAKDKLSPELTRTLAATYSNSRESLTELLDDKNEQRRMLVLAAYLEPFEHGRFPIWVRQIFKEDKRLIGTLLGTQYKSDELVLKFLNEFHEIPFAYFPSVLARIGEYQERIFFRPLLDICLRSAIPGYIDGTIAEAEVAPVLKLTSTNDWLERANHKELHDLLTHQIWNQGANWQNAWKLLFLMPSAIYGRGRPLVPEVIESLLRAHNTPWSPAVAHTWAEILRRFRRECQSQQASLALSVQGLQYSFYNSSFPLSEVVSEVFLEVYKAVTSPSGVPKEASILFGLLDWDKGKELRKSIIEAFMFSHWPPGDLAFAVNDPSLFRKIFKRIFRRSNGKQYLQSMLEDLNTRDSKEAEELAIMLRSLLDNPDFYEEWD